MEPNRVIWLEVEPTDEQWQALHRAADRIFIELGELVVFRVNQPLDEETFRAAFVDFCPKIEYEPVTLAEDWDAELPLSPSVCGSRGVRLEARLPRCRLRSRGPPGRAPGPAGLPFRKSRI